MLPCRPMFRLILVFAVFAALLSPAKAQRLRATPDLATSPAEIARYQGCLATAEKTPDEGFEQAMAWRDTTGSNAAKHCVAVALFYLGQPAVAADRLEKLAIDMRAAPPEVRARMLSQAGTAWSVANEPERANAAISSAIEIAPELADLYVDRASVLAQVQNYWEAIDDLNKALDLQPGYGVALAFRAAAYRYVDSFDLALDDAEQAVRAAPDLPEGWLERGILRRLKGDLNGARADWLRVLVLDPDGDAGDTARANIERLEYRLDDKPANLPAHAGRH